jgi:hypothetical protein
MCHGVNDRGFKSVWEVADAVNMTRLVDIKFPTCHEEQRKIAAGFKAK